ncbi:phage infection protein [Mesorhizobium microcysteis]|uniref:Phage infection protein n=1 Tax=Neoaquamicrobium microcysteis TaxID=2682781 RepID=A0A5D4H2L3_9HYPH|nr:AAA family ATPase [Mesorhizobium microcysteis]TYR34878.1 phage infection protein [Mesorhizobium microcysteis]
MDRLEVDLEHCYGIKALKTSFDFEKSKAYAIYAPNGAMKTSFAKTFQDVAKGLASGDRIFPARIGKRTILDETGAALDAENVLVVQPYDEVFGHTEKTSTLLVNSDLRLEYERLHVETEDAKEVLLKALKKQSGSKRDLENEISRAFTASDNQFFKALLRVESEILEQKDMPFADLKYDILFDEKAVEFLSTPDVRSVIKEYIEKYNELIAASVYFKKGVFNYYNAGAIAKSLADNGFFKAKHSLRLHSDAPKDISTREELEELIAKEKEAISEDAELRKKFAEIENLLQKNAGMRTFDAYLSEHEDILPFLENMASFREEVWKSYLKTHQDKYADLIGKYRAAQKRRGEIEVEAAKERTQWEEVIDIFNDRFFVPFKLVAKNRVEVILGQQPMLSLGFTFEDGEESASVDRLALMAALSTGEKKALYVLNIIFEIQARQKAGTKTLVVVDDIADSFDYKNKYAIIQYLKDVSEGDNFRQIILTHNFDFFRTVKGRFVGYANCLMVSKSAAGITLNKAAGIDNVFIKDWKQNFFTDNKKRIASIPFMRNLLEFTKGEAHPEYVRLTSLLHWKADSPIITQNDLCSVYDGLFGTTTSPANGTAFVVDMIFQVAEDCLVAGAGANFENKIALSIAIRLKAEQYMVDKIADQAFVNGITSTQTPRLLERFKNDYPGSAAGPILDRVMLMTPENIHLNAFMYEPIIDMSDEHLRKLYVDVKALA